MRIPGSNGIRFFLRYNVYKIGEYIYAFYIYKRIFINI